MPAQAQDFDDDADGVGLDRDAGRNPVFEAIHVEVTPERKVGVEQHHGFPPEFLAAQRRLASCQVVSLADGEVQGFNA